MICPVCLSDNMRVTNSPDTRETEVEIRTMRCKECRNEFYSETRITDVIVNQKAVAIKKARENKTIELLFNQFKQQRFSEMELKRRLYEKNKPTGGMFDELKAD